MRRDNLFRSVKSGGLGLPHLFVKQLVSRFTFLGDPEHPFLRNVIQTQLANFIPSFVVSSYPDVTVRLWGFIKEGKLV